MTDEFVNLYCRDLILLLLLLIKIIREKCFVANEIHTKLRKFSGVLNIFHKHRVL